MSKTPPPIPPWEKIAFGKNNAGWRHSARLAARQAWWTPMIYADALKDSLLSIVVGLGSGVCVFALTTVFVVIQIGAGLCGRLIDATPSLTVSGDNT